MFNRWIEQGLTEVLRQEGIGCIPFSPLAQGMLTNRYLREVPADSRAARAGFLKPATVEKRLPQIQALNAIAERRGQSLAQMALAWVLRLPQVTTVLIGASRVSQLEENIGALRNLTFSAEELAEIEEVLHVEM
jgi:L-glyceraldehyde 3-phosphate reductase